MKITPEQYVKYFKPAADYLIVQRVPLSYEKVGQIYIPKNIIDVQQRFVTVGRVLSVSEIPSQDEYVQLLKDKFQSMMPEAYVGYSFHVTADLAILPQFKFDDGVSLIMLHVLDVTILPENLTELLDLHKKFEEEEEERAKLAVANLELERKRLIAESNHA